MTSSGNLSRPSPTRLFFSPDLNVWFSPPLLWNPPNRPKLCLLGPFWTCWRKISKIFDKLLRMDEPLLHLNVGAMMRESSSERSFPNLNQRFEGLKASIWVPKVRFKFGKRLISNGWILLKQNLLFINQNTYFWKWKSKENLSFE